MNELWDRRSFLQTGAAAGAAWAMGRECFAADASDVKARPTDKVRIGLVGIGARGTGLLDVLLDLESVAIKAVCDIIPERVAKAQAMVTAAKQPQPTGYARSETDFMDVYDAATWSCITELSERSVANTSRPMDFPDFTHGRWKTTPPLGIIGL
jgi:hypothetical protein